MIGWLLKNPFFFSFCNKVQMVIKSTFNEWGYIYITSLWLFYSRDPVELQLTADEAQSTHKIVCLVFVAGLFQDGFQPGQFRTFWFAEGLHLSEKCCFCVWEYVCVRLHVLYLDDSAAMRVTWHTTSGMFGIDCVLVWGWRGSAVYTSTGYCMCVLCVNLWGQQAWSSTLRMSLFLRL